MHSNDLEACGDGKNKTYSHLFSHFIFIQLLARTCHVYHCLNTSSIRIVTIQYAFIVAYRRQDVYILHYQHILFAILIWYTVPLGSMIHVTWLVINIWNPFEFHDTSLVHMHILSILASCITITEKMLKSKIDGPRDVPLKPTSHIS